MVPYIEKYTQKTFAIIYTIFLMKTEKTIKFDMIWYVLCLNVKMQIELSDMSVLCMQRTAGANDGLQDLDDIYTECATNDRT